MTLRYGLLCYALQFWVGGLRLIELRHRIFPFLLIAVFTLARVKNAFANLANLLLIRIIFQSICHTRIHKLCFYIWISGRILWRFLAA